jgi:FkbM family methyltransferase
MLRQTLRRVFSPLMHAARRVFGIVVLDARADARFKTLSVELTSVQNLLSDIRNALQANIDRTEALHTKFDQSPLGVIYSLSEKLDILLHHRHTTPRTDAHISKEVNRLDDYLNYHVETLMASLDVILSKVSKRETVYLAPKSEAVLDLDGFDVIIPAGEIGLITFFTRHPLSEFEPAVQSALRRHLKSGMVAIDCGVNIGLHSLIMASAVGADGSVVGFEALPKLAATASHTLSLNGFGPRYRIVQGALADQVGEVEFYVADHSPMSSLFPSSESQDHPTTIRCTTLDNELPPGSRVDLIKMDIEGAEYLAWRGMSRVLADNPGVVIIMEWSSSHMERSRVDGVKFFQEILAAGFSAWILRDESPDEPLALDRPDVNRLDGANLLFKRL